MHGASTNGADAVIRLPWIPYGDELGEIIQPSTRDLLLKLGATPVDAPGYFKPPTESSEAYRLNQAQRYQDPNFAPPPPAPK